MNIIFTVIPNQKTVIKGMDSLEPDSLEGTADAIDTPDSIERAISDGIDLNGAPLPKEMVIFYQEVMEKEAARICRVRVAMRKKVVSTGVRHYDRETLNQKLLEAGWEGLKAAEIAYYYS